MGRIFATSEISRRVPLLGAGASGGWPIGRSGRQQQPGGRQRQRPIGRSGPQQQPGGRQRQQAIGRSWGKRKRRVYCNYKDASKNKSQGERSGGKQRSRQNGQADKRASKQAEEQKGRTVDKQTSGQADKRASRETRMRTPSTSPNLPSHGRVIFHDGLCRDIKDEDRLEYIANSLLGSVPGLGVEYAIRLKGIFSLALQHNSRKRTCDFARVIGLLIWPQIQSGKMQAGKQCGWQRVRFYS